MRLLTAKEVALIIQTPVARVYELARLNLLPSVRMGRQVRFNEEALRRWVSGGGTAAGKGLEQEAA
ncbi:MAG: helix-turn-helix domain-containing protein [Acidobacteriota bacterium]|jgi:excisionase family DNA binding protein|nr:helix-turn-helix domain-containing protein [Acidobacteriota bacterium]MDQ5835453.1 helix-turn-helix domain-containing protein [Acidobacteriota bacterium]